MHESRHLHAVRRARDCGGRFFNTKKEVRVQAGNGGHKVKDVVPRRPAASPSSEVPQSDSLNLNSASGGSSGSGSEVTSVCTHNDVDDFGAIRHLHPSVLHSLSRMMNGGQSTSIIHRKWGAAADGCCDLRNV
ncbi:hypothetical protein BHM03_00004112 [Ensete ventricosum]|uniref:Nuclear transcription factor Y subunit n=1 Tax=Ensete ventricosum TaxID=4639 RepID=A0A427AIV1_ENSVE|nr:hypothetical protein B296_00005947 [Ensete ventricosum]RZR78690.1 hypothetical protein BHM03_00004112 [Ensete ventricosum]